MKRKAYYFPIKGAACFTDDMVVNEAARDDDIAIVFPPVSSEYRYAYVTEDGIGVASVDGEKGGTALAFMLSTGTLYSPAQMLEKLKRHIAPREIDIPDEVLNFFATDALYPVLCDLYAEVGEVEITFNQASELYAIGCATIEQPREGEV